MAVTSVTSPVLILDKKAVAASPQPPTPLQISSRIVKQHATAIIADIITMFTNEIHKMAQSRHGQDRPEARLYIYLNFKTFRMRPEHLVQTHSLPSLESDIIELNESQKNCYNAILAQCIHKINRISRHLLLRYCMVLCEPEIQEGCDFSKSKILRSRVLHATLAITGSR